MRQGGGGGQDEEEDQAESQPRPGEDAGAGSWHAWRRHWESLLSVLSPGVGGSTLAPGRYSNGFRPGG